MAYYARGSLLLYGKPCYPHSAKQVLRMAKVIGYVVHDLKLGCQVKLEILAFHIVRIARTAMTWGST